MGKARRMAAAAVPVAVPAAMRLVFDRLARRYGDRRGYRAAFVGYWATCAAVPLALAGPRRLRRVLRRPPDGLPRPRWLAVTALAVPLAGAVATELLPRLRGARPRTVATALAVGAANGVLEELLWRGLPIAMFPDDPVNGFLVPAAGFTAWHLAPLAVRPHPRGRYPIVAGAALIGLGYGWIAWSTGSPRLALAAHAATDSCGIRAAQAVWVSDHGR